MSITVFKHPPDLLDLRDLLYGEGPQQRRGLAKAKAYQTRGPLPPSVHLTCQLLAAIHADLPTVDLYAIRLTYSMALIRFVNEILDTAQQGRVVVPLYTLAVHADLPASFVELRHAATHEDLPSVQLLREMANRALNWLWTKFWGLQKEPLPASGSAKELLREWRRIKRADSRAVCPQPLVLGLVANWQADRAQFNHILMTQNVLVPSTGGSPAAVVALYMPVFEAMGEEFCGELEFEVLTALADREWPLAKADPRESRHFPVMQAWSEALAMYINKTTEGLLIRAPRPWNAVVLARYALYIGNNDLYETAADMAEFTGADIPVWQIGWKKVPNWTPRALGVY